MRPVLAFATIALSASLVFGCGGAGPIVQKGIDRYERLDYAGAANEFGRLGGREGDMNEKGLVRYYVYDGLTAYHLGYRPQAFTLLSRGKALYARGTPGWIKPGVVAQMDAALADLSGAPAAAPPPAAPGAPPTGPTIIILPAH